MAEPGDPFQIMTQYPEGRPAYSPRPGGIQAADHQCADDAEQRDEPGRNGAEEPRSRPSHGVFRPQGRALIRSSSTRRRCSPPPPHLIRSTAATVFAGSHRGEGSARPHPLVEARRRPGLPPVLSRLQAPAGRADQPVAAHRYQRRRLPAQSRRGRRHEPPAARPDVLGQLRGLDGAPHPLSADRTRRDPPR